MAFNFEDRVTATGLRLYDLAEGEKPSLFKKDYWTGKVMDWSMKNEAFKEEMFRFVDVFPYLTRPESVARHIQEYFCRPDQDFPKSMQWGLKMVKPDSLTAKMAAKSIAKNIHSMGKQFIIGATLKEAAAVMKKLRNKGVAWTVKILKEAVTSKKDEEDFMTKQIELLDELNEIQKQWPALGGGSGDLDWGFTPKNNVSLMASCLFSQYLNKACAFDYSVDRAKERLRPIYRKAMQVGAYVLMDMEHLPAREFTLAVFKSINEEPEFSDYPHKGIAYQAYLRDSATLLKDLLNWACKQKQDFGIRLVKGAFWDEEVVLANQYNYPIPVFANKHETDASYEKCARMILENHRYTMLKCASHNVRTVAFVLEAAKDLRVPDDRLEFQMLHGMAENLRSAWIKMGLYLRLYTPVGEIIPGMAYLVRRLLENTSNESFLRQSFADGASKEQMLKNPVELAKENPEPEKPPKQTPVYGDKGPFQNEPPIEWTTENRKAFSNALQNVKKRFPQIIPLYIGGQKITTGKEIRSTNPNNPDEVIGVVTAAGVSESEKAIAAAKTAFSAWSNTSPAKRSEYLFKAAAIVRENRHRLAALLIYEAGKNWNEAHAEICEASDFLEFYGREMIRLGVPRRIARFPGETSELVYIPKGVGAVIAPWNFPFSISIGMSAAAIVTGNTAVYKPAPQVPVIGAAAYRIFEEAGLPEGVLNFITGTNAIGEFLVTHPDVAFTAFTGSKEVGLGIIEKSGKTPERAEKIKTVIAMMGGNNAIIVDSDADLDEAVGHIVRSSFSYMGLKCSSCSRLIVLEENYGKFVTRFKNAVETLCLGPAEDPKTDVSAVIDEAVQKKIEGYIETGKQEGKLLLQHTSENAPGHFVPPTVFTDIRSDSRLTQEEIFGPVVCIFKAENFDEALEVANNTPYALTGGVFSRSPANIEKACKGFEVGNLYINRPITGAFVERHPFGGYKMSGVGSKSMGSDYLPQFMFSRTIVENTFRSGFAPMENA
ncbi:MAG TPA: bifunctional proline dehydrogenase/L-glutamate gamma-semialdehyde dehydrogenase [Deltaproteobacteria bacterium]|nr:bifunctional proline dehydrogenase/L-glutamate gamma-semialdehyde dehydrogenase [Deltaproteobacteria bacterium]